jgi:hypothetical protein
MLLQINVIFPELENSSCFALVACFLNNREVSFAGLVHCKDATKKP